jgi:FdhD protein
MNIKSMQERVVRFSVDGEPFPPFLCTPDSLEDLAVGHLLAQGWIDSVRRVVSVSADGLSVSVITSGGVTKPPFADARIDALPAVLKIRVFSLEMAVEMVRALVEVDGYYGTHGLMLRAPGETWTRQDIGRHNAMDKVIGRAALAGADLSRCAVAATGRISLEMLLKAATVGIPFISSKKYPSDLRQELAERLGICIVGNALSDTPVIYSAKQKICASSEQI